MSDAEDEYKSRTQLKREAAELQELAGQLVSLSTKRLRALPLSETTFDAVLGGRDMERSALRRQLRRIGGLLAQEDVEAIRDAMEAPLTSTDEVTTAERWRDELVAGDDDLLMDFVELYPATDRRHLRRLTLNARKSPAKAAGPLLSYLEEVTRPNE